MTADIRQYSRPSWPAQRRPEGSVPTWFLDAVDHLRAHQSGYELASNIGEQLRRLVEEPGWLSADHQAPGSTDYRQHILHVASDGGFSVVSLVWTPGQATVVHDHVSWCVVGVCRGLERETKYGLFSVDGRPALVEQGAWLAHPGDVAVLVPPDEDIHQVSCAGDALTVSIHVYGADIGRLGSSINHRFCDVPIHRQAPPGAQAVRWRDLYVE